MSYSGRKYQHNKLLDATPDGGIDGRPIIDNGDALLAALWQHHSDKRSEAERDAYFASFKP